jgi:hypothetical protein
LNCRPVQRSEYVRATSNLVAFPAYQLLVLEERLRERQEAGELPAKMDPTDFALRLLVAAELTSHGR